MMDKQKTVARRLTQRTMTKFSEEADRAMREGQYRRAIECFKKLNKAQPDGGWRAELDDAYWHRATELAGKALYREAFLILGRLSDEAELTVEQCFEVNTWRLESGLVKEAIDEVYQDPKMAQNPEITAKFDQLLSVLMLFQGTQLRALLPSDSPLRKHAAAAQMALTAYCDGQTGDALTEPLSKISFRSPYRDLRKCLNALISAEAGDFSKAEQIASGIDSGSVFSSLANVVRAVSRDQQVVPETSLALTPEEREFYCRLLGSTPTRKEMLSYWMAHRNKPADEKVPEFAIKFRESLDPELISKARFALVVDDESLNASWGRKVFGALSAMDSARMKALRAEKIGDLGGAALLWLALIEQLKKQQSNPDSDLEISAVYRHLAEQMLAAIPSLRQDPSDQILNHLEMAARFDPDDPATYRLLIELYGNSKIDRNYHGWVNRAVERFPEDNGFLLSAIAAANRRKAYKATVSYATRLLKRDPINRQAREYLIGARISHARKSLRAGKYHLMEKELDAISELVRESDGRIELIRGLAAVKAEQPDEARRCLAEAAERCSSGLAFALRLLTEAKSLQIKTDIAELKQPLNAALAQPVSRDQLIDFIRVANRLRAENMLVRAMFDTLGKPLRHLAETLDQRADFALVGEFFFTIRHFKLLKHFASRGLRRWRMAPLFVFFDVYATCSGSVTSASMVALDRLDIAHNMAKFDGDERTALRIAEFMLPISVPPPIPAGAPINDSDPHIDSILEALGEIFGDLGEGSEAEQVLRRIAEMEAAGGASGGNADFDFDLLFPPSSDRKRKKGSKKKRRRKQR